MATTPEKPALEGSEAVTPTAKPPAEPTRTDTLMFHAIIKNLKIKPEIDWEGVAQDTGLKNGSVASVSSAPDDLLVLR